MTRTNAITIAALLLSGVSVVASAQTAKPAKTGQAVAAPAASVPLAKSPTATSSPVTLSSDVKIERVAIDAAGKEKVTLHAPKDVVVVPGDKVVFRLQVTNTGAVPATGFRATNPMPGSVQFVSVAQDWAEVSVDGGVQFGKLAALKVKSAPAVGGPAVQRAADVADVTHVRWVFPDAIAPGGTRQISYRGVIK
jgi:uncharacterized repeat protein (TIGR01451 family)